MGSGEVDMADEKGGGGEGAPASQALVPCSICLEAVKDGGERSTAKLLCGHQFHLDCIGSAFNAKGVMQCPNCRKIEKGDWLYANGCLQLREMSMDDWTYDEDIYSLDYSEMSYGVHWCPFTRFDRVPSAFEEGESPSISYHGLDGHRAVFSVHPTLSLAHSCPYVAYLHPLQSSSSSSSQVSTESIADGPTFHHHWSNRYGPINIQTSHAFPAVDIHYHAREAHLPHSHPSSRIGGADQASVPAATRATARHDSDGQPRAGNSWHPFFIGHGNSQMETRVQDLPGIYQHHSAVGTSSGVVPGTQRSSGTRGLTSRAPALSDHAPLYLFPSASSSGLSQQDAETTGVNHFYAWERDQLTPFPLMPVERDSAWWGSFQQAPGPSDTGSRMGSWHQHGSERSSSQGRSEDFSHPPIQPPQMYPFI